MWEAVIWALPTKHHASKQLYFAGTGRKETGKKECGEGRKAGIWERQQSNWCRAQNVCVDLVVQNNRVLYR
jgi:hypothetical protein